MRITPILLATTTLLAGLATMAGARQVALVRQLELPRQLPAVGNIEAVERWHFGRLELVEQSTGTPDIVLQIRTEGGEVIRVTAPGPPLLELARASNWFEPARDTPGRNDYVERMIAFDADEDDRLIAMMSLEPIRRSNARLRRVFGGRR
jgi:hypothetical protein